MAEEKTRDSSKEKDIEKDIPRHRKKSKSAARSVSGRRADHKHDYEGIIIRDVDGESFFRGGRCRICGRVKDDNWSREDAYKDFVRKTVNVKGYSFRVFYKLDEIRGMYPGTMIMARNETTREYEEI